MNAFPDAGAGNKMLDTADARHFDGIRSTSTGTMSLNWDILTEIMSFLDCEDASRMSRTCHILLRAAPRILLSRGECESVTRHKPWQFLSFCQFMFSGRHNGFQYLTRLMLSPNRQLFYMPQLGKLMADILVQATELRLFKLHDCKILDIDNRAGCAFTNLEKLRTLQISSFTDGTFVLLKKMKAPLTGIDANFTRLRRLIDPVPVFARFKGSLRAMDVVGVAFHSTEIQYPRVLSLSTNLDDATELERIALCFPNLQDFYMHIYPNGYTVEDVEENRLSNLALQTRSTWPSLRRLSSTVLELYMLGIRCSVGYVDVARQSLSSAVDGRRLAAILTDVRPTSLSIRLRIPRFDPLSLAVYLAPIKGRLAELELTLEYDWCMDPNSHINNVLETLSAFVLRTLDIFVCWTWDTVAAVVARFPESDQLEKMEALRVGNLDLVGMAQQAMWYIPTLLFVAVGHSYPPERRVFKVANDGDSPESVKKLSDVVTGSAAWDEFWGTTMYKPWWNPDCSWYSDE